MIYYKLADHLIQVSGNGLYRVSGFLPFVSTGNAGKEPVLQIEMGVHLRDWDIVPLSVFPFSNKDVTCSFAVNNGTYLFRMEQPGHTSALMEIKNQNGRILATTNMDEQSPPELLRFGCWIAFGIASVHHQTVAFHASTVCYGGKSLLFLGESGTGKSTHTRLWLNHIPDTELLNDDSPLICIMDDGAVSAFGSPWSGKTPCYKNKNTPVAAIVRLSQAPHNKITQLKGISALTALLPSCPPAFAYDETLFSNIISVLNIILMQIPVYSLECLPNPEAAQLVFDTLRESGKI